MRLNDAEYLLIDIGGVLFRGDSVLPNVREFLSFLLQSDLSYLFISNDSTSSPGEYAQRFRSIGFDIRTSQVLTSSQVTAQYLMMVAPRGSKIYVVGESYLVGLIEASGFQIDADRPDFVVFGLNRNFEYWMLRDAGVAVAEGARFIATDPEPNVFAGGNEIAPGCGAFVAAMSAFIEVARRNDPLKTEYTGKPSSMFMEMALERIGAVRSKTAVIGDSLITDIAGAKRAGVTSVLLLTGMATRTSLRSDEVRPDYVFDDLGQLLPELRATR